MDIKVCVRISSVKVLPSAIFRILFSKRLLGGSHSSQSNLSQASVTSDPLAADDADGSINSQHAKISERRSNSSSDIHGRGEISLPIIPKQRKSPKNGLVRMFVYLTRVIFGANV